MRKSMILAAVLTVMGAATALAQGIVVNKTDGSKVYFKASEVVSVTTYGYGEDPHAPAGAEAVDLGLPSGTKWANMNVGAEKPEDYGLYFAWGETEPKAVYTDVTYSYFTGEDTDGFGFINKNFSVVGIGSDIAGTGYDAATANWGNTWRMPSLDQIKELRENCTSEWMTQNGVHGRKFTSKKNGNSIFFPAAGYRWSDVLYYVGADGTYWSSTLDESNPYCAYYLYFDSEDACWDSLYSRGHGRSVRPVR